VHCNAFFPMFLLLYVLQLVLCPVLLMQRFIARVLSAGEHTALHAAPPCMWPALGGAPPTKCLFSCALPKRQPLVLCCSAVRGGQQLLLVPHLPWVLGAALLGTHRGAAADVLCRGKGSWQLYMASMASFRSTLSQRAWSALAASLLGIPAALRG
jgi:hypothetical protein